MKQALIISQGIISIFLIILILLQQRGQALGSIFGQGGGFYGTRRGAEKKIFLATIVFAVVFVVLALLNLVF